MYDDEGCAHIFRACNSFLALQCPSDPVRYTDTPEVTTLCASGDRRSAHVHKPPCNSGNHEQDSGAVIARAQRVSISRLQRSSTIG